MIMVTGCAFKSATPCPIFRTTIGGVRAKGRVGHVTNAALLHAEPTRSGGAWKMRSATAARYDAAVRR
jgi:hypothetical protein